MYIFEPSSWSSLMPPSEKQYKVEEQRAFNFKGFDFATEPEMSYMIKWMF